MANLSNWQFEITDVGKADLARLDKEVQGRVLEKLKWFTENFQDITPLPLGGQWRGFFKLRAGEWRIIYEVKYDTRRITVHVIDNRDRIYKRKFPRR